MATAAMSLPESLEVNSRCQRWLDEIHGSADPLAPLDSIPSSPTSRSRDAHHRASNGDLHSSFAFPSAHSSISLGTTHMTANVEDNFAGFYHVGARAAACVPRITIPKWSHVQDTRGLRTVMYHLACRSLNTTWEVRKRYSDFNALDQQMEQQYRLAILLRIRQQRRRDTKTNELPMEPLPRLPPRRYWPATNSDVSAIITRCLALQQYLQQLLMLQASVQPNSPVVRFLSGSNVDVVETLSTTHLLSTHATHPSPTVTGSLKAGSQAADCRKSPAALLPPVAGADTHRSSSELSQEEEAMLAKGLHKFNPARAVVRVEYPDWVLYDNFWMQEFRTDVEKMTLAIDISRKNISNATGGPFGAAIFNAKTGKLVSVGMSLVGYTNNCCMHAEMVAVQMATTVLGMYSLDSPETGDGVLGEHELFTSSEPCAMCIGATMWSGVHKLVCAATDVDVRSLLHDTGPVFEESFRYLAAKGMSIQRKFMRDEAKQVLCEYSVAVPHASHGRQV